MIKVIYEVEYDFSNPDIWSEYSQWLDDHADTMSTRKWFAIDRAVGHEENTTVDPQGIVRIVWRDNKEREKE